VCDPGISHVQPFREAASIHQRLGQGFQETIDPNWGMGQVSRSQLGKCHGTIFWSKQTSVSSMAGTGGQTP
jgi:hypothetical protein